MSIEDAARAAIAQWRGRTVGGVDLPTVMTAIAGAESSWRNDGAGDPRDPGWGVCHAYASWGLWQIYMPAHGEMLGQQVGIGDACSWAQWLSDPIHCARAADIIIGNPAPNLPLSALRPWTTWWSPDGDPHHDAGDGSGIYLQHMDAAKAAVAAGLAAESGGSGGNQPGSLPVTVTIPRAGTLIGGALIMGGVFGALILGMELLAGGRKTGP